MADVLYSKNEEVQKIVNEFIDKVPRFAFINKDDIFCTVRISEHCRYKACVYRVPEKIWPVMERQYSLGLIVWQGAWEGLSSAVKHLIILHELFHIIPGKKKKYQLVRHDVEDWKEVLSQAGLNWEKPEFVFELLKKEKDR